MTQPKIAKIKADILSQPGISKTLIKSIPWYLRLWRWLRPVQTGVCEKIIFKRFSPYEETRHPPLSNEDTVTTPSKGLR